MADSLLSEGMGESRARPVLVPRTRPWSHILGKSRWNHIRVFNEASEGRAAPSPWVLARLGLTHASDPATLPSPLSSRPWRKPHLLLCCELGRRRPVGTVGTGGVDGSSVQPPGWGATGEAAGGGVGPGGRASAACSDPLMPLYRTNFYFGSVH